MSLNISLPNEEELKPRIIVFGVGGAGSNAVDNMISLNLEGIEFWAANTDSQALNKTLTENRIRLGITSTKGLGAGSDPAVGKLAAEESANECMAALDNCNMVFITAGMGGGTGTGGAPVIAKLAKEKNILTVGVVTKPFHFEGARRMKVAEAGIEELEKYVDTLIIIPNQNLFRLANEKTTFADAFRMADDVLHSGVRGVTDLITMPGLINLDFADIHSVMNEKGKAMMGTGEAEGENRATKAAEAAISNPLLDHSSMKGARGVLINITGGTDMTLFEVDEAANRIKEEVDEKANIIFGSAFDNNSEGRLRVSVVATGIDAKSPKIINDSVVNQSGTIDFENTKQNLQVDDIKKEDNDEYVDNSSENQDVDSSDENFVTSEEEVEQQQVLDEEQQQDYSQPTIDPDNVKDMVSTSEEQDTPEPEDNLVLNNTTNEDAENNGTKDVFDKVASVDVDENSQNDNEKDRQKTLDMKSDHIFEIPAFLRKKKK